MFLAYGLSDRLGLEVEAAMTRARLPKSPDDLSGMPRTDRIGAGGRADGAPLDVVEEYCSCCPGFFSYGEVVFPFQKNKSLIGTPELETKAGVGLIKGFTWGTVTVRAAVEQAGGVFELGEYAVEYYKRLSKSICLYGGIEGTQDEVEFISEIQLWLSDTVRFKINNAFGLTSKAAGAGDRPDDLFRNADPAPCGGRAICGKMAAWTLAGSSAFWLSGRCWAGGRGRRIPLADAAGTARAPVGRVVGTSRRRGRCLGTDAR